MAKPPSNTPEPTPSAPSNDPPPPQDPPKDVPQGANGIVISGAGFDFNLYDAKAAQHAQRAIEVYDMVERDLHQAQFRYVPQPMKDANYHFTCMGQKGVKEAEEKAQFLRNLGYLDAPPFVRCVGREKEGDQSLILCARPEVWARLRNEKIGRAQDRHERLSGQNVKSIEARLRDGLTGKSDLTFTTTMGTARSVAAADDEIRRASKEVGIFTRV